MGGDIRDVREVIREEMLVRNKIMSILKEGPRTIPEIAGATGYPSYEVVFWIMGMRKYGYVSETGEVTDDGYYKYGAVARDNN